MSATLKKTVPASINYTYIFLLGYDNNPDHYQAYSAG